MNTFSKQPQTQQKALRKALKSPYIGKHGKRKTTLALEKAVEKKAENIVSDMFRERSKMVSLLAKKRDEATFRDLIYGIDILTKNMMLLSGKNTGREGMGALSGKFEEGEKVTFKWEE